MPTLIESSSPINPVFTTQRVKLPAKLCSAESFGYRHARTVGRRVHTAAAARPGAALRDGTGKGWLRAGAPEILERPESLWTCVQTGRPCLDASPDEDRTWGSLGQPVRSPEEAGLKHVPRREERWRKATVGGTFRLPECIPRPAPGRRDVGSRAQKEEHATYANNAP
ncbi:hypothetical protein T12_14869 [Trichinella patagoniensis]|uniref:Uncharacterized protein n=1 Tax=Trichinella patagoniensis TaxID=990121 RepID=A0A0V0YZB0_9BILA|nr:hypothetical protein T12_14869 [Trichinella patagoniensis]